jgi:addiction module HigA family antidote
MSIKRPANGWNIRRPPVHPGEMLREEFLTPLELSGNRLAMELRVPVTRISEIVKGRRAVSADTALRLERYFGMSADFWLGLQKDFDLQTARQTQGKKIAQDVRPLQTKPHNCTFEMWLGSVRRVPTHSRWAAAVAVWRSKLFITSVGLTPRARHS